MGKEFDAWRSPVFDDGALRGIAAARPIWFLDVDGVLNAFPPPKAHKPYAAQFRHVEVPATGTDGVERAFPIWYRPAAMDAVNAMHRSGVVEVVWLTTWGRQAITRLAPAIGLDEFGCLDGDDGSDPHSPTWWKLRAIGEQIQVGNRFVFTDDSLRKDSRRALRDVYGDDALLITPMSSPGLTDAHLEQIRAFVERPTPKKRSRGSGPDDPSPEG